MSDLSDLSSAEEVRVIKGSGFDARNRKNNKQLLVTDDREAVAELAALMTQWSECEAMDWMERPVMSAVFLHDRNVLAELGFLGGAQWVRTPGQGDRKLERPDAVVRWLAQRGLDPR